MNYEEVISFLYSQLQSFQKIGKSAYKPGLQNAKSLDEYFNYPHKNYKTIHVAGTNGKGSVSHMLASVLQEAGLKTGLFTSPHLKDFRERIKVNGLMITEDEVVTWFETHKEIIEKVKPSFFEMTSTLAFDYFAEREVDFAVIETGLGGRLDSTNIIKPVLSVITNIGFDHTDLLGNTLGKIAFEKAGIIKKMVPVVIGETNSETKSVFEDKADEMTSELVFADQKYRVDKSFLTANQFRMYNIFLVGYNSNKGMKRNKFLVGEDSNKGKKGKMFLVGEDSNKGKKGKKMLDSNKGKMFLVGEDSNKGKKGKMFLVGEDSNMGKKGKMFVVGDNSNKGMEGKRELQVLEGLKTQLLGEYQERNVVTVLAAIDKLREVGILISDHHIFRGFRNVVSLTGLLGRWQVLSEKPYIVCDTGHNTDGIIQVVKQIQSCKFNKLYIVLGMVGDKDVKSVLKLLPTDAIYFFTKANIPRAMNEELLKEKAADFNLCGNCYSSVSDAYTAAKAIANDDDMIFVGGSTFVVAEVV